MPYLQQNGLSQTQISLAIGCIWLWALLVTVHAGRFADRYGRKWALVTGSVLLSLAFVVFSVGYGFWPILCSYSLLGIGYGCMAESDKAMAYDLMKQVGWEDRYLRFEANAFSYRTTGAIISALVGSWLCQEVGTKTVFLLQVVLYLAAMCIAFSLREPQLKTVRSPNLRETVRRILWGHGELRRIVIYLMIGFVGMGTITYLRPLYYQAVGVPVSWFGVLQAGLMVVSATAARFASRLEGFDRWKVLRLLMAANIVCYCLLGLCSSLWILPLFGVVWALTGLSGPITSRHINQLVGSEVRATTLSASGAVNKVGLLVMTILAGWLTDAFTLSAAFFVLAGVCGSIGAYALRVGRHVPVAV